MDTVSTTPIQDALQRWTLPVALLAAPVVAVAAQQAGVPDALVLVCAALTAVAIAVALERAIPYRGQWRHDHGDTGQDAFLGAVNLAVPAVYRVAVDALGLTAAGQGAGLWPSSLPWMLQFVLALLLADLGAYLGHRLVHRVPALWRLHSVHHSAPRLYWLNSQRFHPVDLLLIHGASMTPLLLLGVGAEVLLPLACLTLTNALLQHSNADLKGGVLVHFVATAELHRWHHAQGPNHTHWNYGSLLIVWDRLLGTHHSHHGPQPVIESAHAASTAEVPQ